MEELDDYVKRIEELLGPNSWQEHIPPTPEPVPESQALVEISDNEPSSDLLNSPPKKNIMRSVAWPETGLAKGGKSQQPAIFVPWRLVKSYPHMYIGKTNAQRAQHFFDNPTIHKQHPWDLYYVYDPSNLKDSSHILLVPTYQFEHFLDVINHALDTVLTIPGNKNAEKFNLMFGIGGTPVPRFLGRSNSMEEFEALQKSLPPYNPEDDISGLSTLAHDDFLEKLKNIRTSGKGSKSKRSEKKRVQRIQDHRSWGKSLKRVQRYLGIRKQASRNGSGFPDLAKLSIADTDGTKTSPVKVPVAEPERGVVFVAIDMEAYEFSPGLITEIGVAVFDTLDTINQPPGDKGTDWFNLIRGYHFRIKENSWATNKVHVDGHAEKFEFGTTEFVSKHRIKKLVTKIIDNPLSLGEEDKTKAFNRPVVLVFHDQDADLKYLESLDYDIEGAKNVLEIVDTRDSHQHGVKAMNPASLERVLDELKIPSRFLHNAGNDAVYTMRAMIGLAFKQRVKSIERALEEAKGGPLAAQPKDDEGWLTGGEESDGGKPGEKGRPGAWSPNTYLRGAAFQPGADVPSRVFPPPMSEKSHVFSWSDSDDGDDEW
ncbi:hypothetical protein GE09DRAFT_1271130 [Coniochaeta sp. 2T2.1]|nr:hypothetical protein GE09DRAFT_1271130 [Coniochaeta sp. 2T2.1]